MFWGLIMEPDKRYTQTVDKSFHVSMASLDARTADNAIVQVMLFYNDCNYLLCSLKKDVDWQVPLDLNFQEGTKIAFTSNGRGHVHLTGYHIPEEEDDLDLDELEDEEEDDEEVPRLVSNQPKRKASESPKGSTKIKRWKAPADRDESSDDEENAEDEDDESPELGGEVDDDSDEADEDDDEGEEEEEEEEEEEDDSEDEEDEKVQVKLPQKKNKQKEQPQQKSTVKQEKQKLVNGKDVKQEQTKQQTKKNKPEQQQQQQSNAQQLQKKRIVEGGVQIEDLKVGNGSPVKPGKFISVYYVGRLKNGKKFDSTMQGEGFKFRLGKGEVIKGWDVGIAGMKVGGKRRITIPPPFAYGAKGSPPTIPGNSTLVFDVEIKKIH